MSFIVAKQNINTVNGTHKEFNGCVRRGIGFFSGPSANTANRVWHYLFPSDKIEQSIKDAVNAALPAGTLDAHGEPEAYIWSQEVTTGDTVGEPLITAYFDDAEGESSAEWQESAQRIWTSATVTAAPQAALSAPVAAPAQSGDTEAQGGAPADA